MEHAKMKTIGECAEEMAALDNLHSDSYIARQIRTWVQLGVITPHSYKGEGRTAAALFRPCDMLPLRILQYLAKLGLPPDNLRRVAGCFRNQLDGLPVGKRFEPGYAFVYERITDPENEDRWYFEVQLPLNFDSANDAVVTGGFRTLPRENHADILSAVNPICIRIAVNEIMGDWAGHLSDAPRPAED